MRLFADLISWVRIICLAETHRQTDTQHQAENDCNVHLVEWINREQKKAHEDRTQLKQIICLHSTNNWISFGLNFHNFYRIE